MPITCLRSLMLLGLLALSGCGGSLNGSNGGSQGAPTVVTFTITGATPTAVASQIGSGSFVASTLTSGLVTINLPGGTTNFGVAFACPSNIDEGNISTTEYVFEASTLDGTSFSEPCLETTTPASSAFLTGSVDASAIPVVSSPGPGPFLNVNAWGGGGVSGASATWFGPAFDFAFTAPSGSDRVEVEAYNTFQTSVGGVGEGISLAAARNFGSQTVPGALNGGNTVVLGPADETTPEAITYSNVPPGFLPPYTTANLEMSGNTSFAVDTAATAQYPALPASAMESGDYYVFNSYASNAGNIVSGVIVTQTSVTALPLNVTFPAAWFYAGPPVAALPTFNFAYSGFSGATDVYNSVILSWMMNSSNEQAFEVTATANFLNGSTLLTVPDLSSLPGFPAPPASGTSVLWEAEISHSTSPLLQPMPMNGTVSSVSNAGWLTVP